MLLHIHVAISEPSATSVYFHKIITNKHYLEDETLLWLFVMYSIVIDYIVESRHDGVAYYIVSRYYVALSRDIEYKNDTISQTVS